MTKRKDAKKSDKENGTKSKSASANVRLNNDGIKKPNRKKPNSATMKRNIATTSPTLVENVDKTKIRSKSSKHRTRGNIDDSYSKNKKHKSKHRSKSSIKSKQKEEPNGAWIVQELGQYKELAEKQIKLSDPSRAIESVGASFTHRIINGVAFAVYKNITETFASHGFIRIPKNMEKKQAIHQNVHIKYWILKGDVTFWFGEKQICANECDVVTIPEDSMHGIVNTGGEVALLEYIAYYP